MAAVDYQPSALTPTSLIRHVRDLLPATIDAVEEHLNETVPDLIVAIGGPAHLATTRLLSSGWRRARPRYAGAYWRHQRAEARNAHGFTCVTHDGRVMVGINRDIAKYPHLLHGTLVHEMVHAVQTRRPGRHATWRATLDHDLRISPHPDNLRHALDAITAVEEAEAYQVEHALGDRSGIDVHDLNAAEQQLKNAAEHWAATSRLPRP